MTVTGVTADDAKRVRSALAATARTMTTLHVREDRLDQAVAGFPVVRALEVTTDFPHGMTIRVIEHVPAAMAVTDAGRVPVAVDGTVLQGLPTPGALPTVRAHGGLKGQRLGDPVALAGARVAGTAPPALRRRLDEVHRDSDRGLVATMREGPELVFGGTRRLREKWTAAARVLADQDAQGAAYVDLRVPGRPAVGGLAFQTVAPPGGGAGAGARRRRHAARHPGGRRRHRRGRGPGHRAAHRGGARRRGAPRRGHATGGRDPGPGRAGDPHRAPCRGRRRGRGSTRSVALRRSSLKLSTSG